MIRVLSWIFGVILTALIVWGVVSLAPRYTIDQFTPMSSAQENGYQIRAYTSYISASVTLTGEFDDATREGTRVLKEFILGDNAKTTNSPFTKSPDQKASEDIAIVQPVIIQSNDDGSTSVTFIMPGDYKTLSSVPTPNNQLIFLQVIHAGSYAVLSFHGEATQEKYTQFSTELLDKLKTDEIETIGSPELRRYDPSWTIPFLQRNEVAIKIK